MRFPAGRNVLAAITVVSSSLTTLAKASNLVPPVLPLIVRNPYLSTWLQDAREAPWSRWPMFYTGMEVGFSIMASVPALNTAYPLLGRPQDSLDHRSGFNVSFPVYLGANYDASTTNLTYRIAGTKRTSDIDIVLSFLSPITPTSTLRQSLPASYVSVHVKGSDDVSVYIDLNGQWVSGNRDSEIQWFLQNIALPQDTNTAKEVNLQSIFVQRQEELLFTEIEDRAEWGHLQLTAPSDVDVQIGTSAKVRRQFARHSKLDGSIDPRVRRIMDDEPIFAFSKTFNLSSVASQSSSRGAVEDTVVFTIAHIQDPVVQYASARGLTFMRPLWKSWLSSVESMLIFHYYDYHNARKLADAYSVQLAKDAYKSGADDYVDIVALSARQVMGATSFSGTPDNPLLFLKEISSNGNAQTIDVIFPAFPFFMYTNPRWLAYLLEPLIEHMLSGQYPNKYAMHDLGTHFPNETGHADGNDEYMPLEECGNILIMGLSLVNSLLYDDSASAGSSWATLGSDYFNEDPEVSAFALTQLGEEEGISYLDDRWGGKIKGVNQAKKWVGRSYKLWKQWTGYLVEFALRPENQLSTDDFAGWLALQTNLALKGIIGIRAMSEIASVVDKAEDVAYFRNISETYLRKWEEYGVSRDGSHAKLAYDWYGSWTTLYNLYADTMLCFHLDSSDSQSQHLPSLHPAFATSQQKVLPRSEAAKQGFVPQHIYTKQSDWYMVVRQKYGLPLDSRHLYTKTDWEFFAMAVASNKTRSTILESVATWLNETDTDRPFTDIHETEGSGGFTGIYFFARPVIGGHFAFLSLERACGGRAREGLSFLEEHEAAKLEGDVPSQESGWEL